MRASIHCVVLNDNQPSLRAWVDASGCRHLDIVDQHGTSITFSGERSVLDAFFSAAAETVYEAREVSAA